MKSTYPMDYVKALQELLDDRPELIAEVQRILILVSNKTIEDVPRVSAISFEVLYKTLIVLANKQSLKA